MFLISKNNYFLNKLYFNYGMCIYVIIFKIIVILIVKIICCEIINWVKFENKVIVIKKMVYSVCILKLIIYIMKNKILNIKNKLFS